MENIIDYIRHTNETFEEKKWNEVDSLVLCQLVYLKFDGLVPEGNLEGKCRRNKEKLTIRRIDQSPERERLFRDERYAKDNREFWVALIHSRRFQNVELDYMVDFVDKDTETQFAAVTFFLPEGRFQSGILQAGSGAGKKRGLSESGGASHPGTALCGRAFQRRKSGYLCLHVLQPQDSEQNHRNLQHGWSGISTGDPATREL